MDGTKTDVGKERPTCFLELSHLVLLICREDLVESSLSPRVRDSQLRNEISDRRCRLLDGGVVVTLQRGRKAFVCAPKTVVFALAPLAALVKMAVASCCCALESDSTVVRYETLCCTISSGDGGFGGSCGSTAAAKRKRVFSNPRMSLKGNGAGGEEGSFRK